MFDLLVNFSFSFYTFTIHDANFSVHKSTSQLQQTLLQSDSTQLLLNHILIAGDAYN